MEVRPAGACLRAAIIAPSAVFVNRQIAQKIKSLRIQFPQAFSISFLGVYVLLDLGNNDPRLW